MKRFDGSTIRLVLLGYVIALLTGGGIANADFTFDTPMNPGPTVGGEGKDNAQSLTVNGKILDQHLNANGQGYTVIRLWGSYYEMGYAHAHLLGDLIVEAVDQIKGLLGTQVYENARHFMAQSLWMPSTIEDELDGMVDSLAETHPNAFIDKIDLKVANTQGDWGYACRSHVCWGRYVAEPNKTLATRRLDFPTTVPIANCHVLCARDPNDGSPRWVNMAWPGVVVLSAGINEYGTLAVVQDYQSFNADLSAGRMSRSVASRYALTFPTGSDVSTHLMDVFTELQKYEIMTGSFIGYYAPEGHGGVMTCHPYRTGPDFYNVRKPQEVWHHGEAIIMTNDWTDGTYTPADEDFRADAYYNDESPKTQESHWNPAIPQRFVLDRILGGLVVRISGFTVI